MIPIAAFPIPIASLNGVRELGFRISSSTKSTGDTSFRGLFAALAAEGSDPEATFQMKRKCALGCFQDKTEMFSSPAVPLLKTDQTQMMTGLLTRAGTQTNCKAVNPQGLNLDFPSAQGNPLPLDGTPSAPWNMTGETGVERSHATQLRELMSADGLDPHAIKALQETGAGAAKDGKAATFINRLMSVLKESGLTSPEIQEVEQMLISLTAERQGVPASQAHLLKTAQELLVRMGFDSTLLDQTVEPGTFSPDGDQNLSAGLAVKPGSADAAAQAAGRSEPGQPAELWKANSNAEQAVDPGKSSPHTGNENLRKLVIQPEAAEGLAGPVSLPENRQTTGSLKTNTHFGQEALLGNAGDASGPTTALNDALKGSPHQAGEKGAILLMGSNDKGEDVNGEGTDASRYDGVGGLAPGSGSTKASSAEGTNFNQQLSRAQGREVTAQKVMDQIVSGARMHVEGGRTRAKIVLQPPALGKVNLHIVTRDDQVRVTFFAETPQVKEIIESNLPQLRQSFSEQGLRADHCEVFVGYRESDSEAWQSHSYDAPGFPGSAEERHRAEDDPALRDGRQRVSGDNIVDVFI